MAVFLGVGDLSMPKKCPRKKSHLSIAFTHSLGDLGHFWANYAGNVHPAAKEIPRP
jgi:hypothetical protein